MTSGFCFGFLLISLFNGLHLSSPFSNSKAKGGRRGNLAKANLVLLWSPTHHFLFYTVAAETPDTSCVCLQRVPIHHFNTYQVPRETWSHLCNTLNKTKSKNVTEMGLGHRDPLQKSVSFLLFVLVNF